MATKIFTAIVRKEEDIYVAECPEVGTVSQGETVESAIANLKEATELILVSGSRFRWKHLGLSAHSQA